MAPAGADRAAEAAVDMSAVRAGPAEREAAAAPAPGPGAAARDFD